MNSLLQQQQELMRQQQEQQRRRMEMSHAWAHQQAEARKQAALARGLSDDPFTRVEHEAALLRQECADGRLTPDQLMARLRELMVQDGRGDWWMVGCNTGEWYRFDGASWVPDTPPGHADVRTAVRPATGTGVPVARRLRGCVAALLGLVMTGVIGSFVYDFIHRHLQQGHAPKGAPEVVAYACYGLVWVAGLVFTIRATRGVWRGR